MPNEGSGGVLPPGDHYAVVCISGDSKAPTEIELSGMSVNGGSEAWELESLGVGELELLQAATLSGLIW